MKKFKFLQEIETHIIDEFIEEQNIDVNGSFIKKLFIGYIFALLFGIICIILGTVIFAISLPIYLVNIIYDLCTRENAAKKERNIRKLIVDYQNELDNLPKLRFKNQNYPFDDLIEFKGTLLEFLVEFFGYFNRYFNTYSINERQCTPNRRRSLGDIYRICKTYFPDCTLAEVLECLIWLLNNRRIGASRCTDIKKFVFHRDSYVFKPKDILEYTNQYKFQDLVDVYGNEEFVNGVKLQL